jgi:branched-chain amino acid transport system substrate-binding protein
VDGFAVKLQILEDGLTIQDHNNLPNIPPAPEIPQLYEDWRNISLENSGQNISPENNRQLQAVPVQVTNVASRETWRNIAEELENACRRWFNHRDFNSLRDRILSNPRVRTDQSVPIIIRCQTGNDQQNEILRRLPWHTWDLFAELPNAEFALFTGFRQPVATLTAPVKVLAIFGSSKGGLQLAKDEEALQFLKERGAQITKILEPDEETLSHLLFDQEWQILFFAGHSSSEGLTGQIQISDGRYLPLHTLRQRLTSAVRNGLKLAIFNSCDGLRIADFLGQLNVPAVIVMREPVPDRIAYQFLLYFLREFSQGTPLCLAVRKARDRLESIQADFPAASWLPTVCLNPSQPEFVWPNITPQKPQPTASNLHFLKLGLAAVAVIIAVGIPIITNRCQVFPTLCPPAPSVPPTRRITIIEEYISDGKRPIADYKVKLSEPYHSLKLKGIAAFSEGKYSDAIKIFDYLRHQYKVNKSTPDFHKAALAALKDPEILIYLNNAMVNLRHQQNPHLPIYTIAVAAPLNVNFGLDMLFGVAQMQDVAVNQNNINLKVVIANDNNNRQQAQQVAKVLADDLNILAVVGHYTSPNTCAALKVYSPENLVVISPTSTVVNLPNSDCHDPNKVFYRTVSSTQVEAKSLVQYLIGDLKKPKPKVVVFYNPREDFSKDLFEHFNKSIRDSQGSIIAKFDLSDSNFDTTKLPPQVSNADALVLLPDGGTDDSMALPKAIEIIKLNQGTKPILAANTMYLQKVIDQAKDANVKSLFLAVDWHPQQCGAANFRKETNKYWGGDLNRRTALAYEAVQAILQAIKLSNSPVTRQDIKQKLSETGTRGDTAASSAAIQGLLIRFDARGDRKEITTRAIVNVKNVNNKLSFELVKDVPCPRQ